MFQDSKIMAPLIEFPPSLKKKQYKGKERVSHQQALTGKESCGKTFDPVGTMEFQEPGTVSPPCPGCEICGC